MAGSRRELSPFFRANWSFSTSRWPRHRTGQYSLCLASLQLGNPLLEVADSVALGHYLHIGLLELSGDGAPVRGLHRRDLLIIWLRLGLHLGPRHLGRHLGLEHPDVLDGTNRLSTVCLCLLPRCIQLPTKRGGFPIVRGLLLGSPMFPACLYFGSQVLDGLVCPLDIICGDSDMALTSADLRPQALDCRLVLLDLTLEILSLLGGEGFGALPHELVADILGIWDSQQSEYGLVFTGGGFWLGGCWLGWLGRCK